MHTINKIDLTGSYEDHRHSTVSGTAGTTEAEGSTPKAFFCTQSVNFIANDSSLYSLLVNFDAPVNRGGSFEIKPGEVINDLKITCTELYVQGVGGSVPYRAIGS